MSNLIPAGSLLHHARPLTLQEVAIITDQKLADMHKRDKYIDEEVAGLNERVGNYAKTILTRQGQDLAPPEQAMEQLEGARLRLANEEKAYPLMPTDRVAILTLMPQSAEEAVALIPSLGRYNPDDLSRLLQSLQ